MATEKTATVRMTLVLWTGEVQVTYWLAGHDAVAWRKAIAPQWFSSTLELI